MTDQVHGPADPLELTDQPLDVGFLGRRESGRAWAAEARKRERNRVGSAKLPSQILPQGGGFGDAVDEDDGHGDTLVTRHELIQDEMPLRAAVRSKDTAPDRMR